MGGGFATGASARVRIKGRTASVLRFFLIAVSYMVAWVLVSSELDYYAKWFGPQILLEMAIAFNLPSIPVLIISGQVEKVLDAQLGPTPSMAIRLLFGLGGCTAVAAAFPFLPHTHMSLLAFVAVLGMLSAIAFSTAYQVVQWFRHADIIALGLGGVGTGPLVLLLQLALGVGANPARWQWVAMFEITALIMTLGLLSALSLFAQYWKVMTGEEEWVDARRPLLPTGGADGAGGSSAEDDLADAKEVAHMRLARMATGAVVLPPDATGMGVTAALTPGAVNWPDEDMHGVPKLQRSASACSTSDPSHRPKGIRIGSWNGRIAASRASPQQQRQQQSSSSQPGDSSARPAIGAVLLATTASKANLTKGSEAAGSSTEPLADASKSAFASAAWQTEDGGGAGNSSAPPQAGTSRAASPAPDGAAPPPMTLWEEHREVMRDAWPVLVSFMVSVTIMYTVFPFFTYVPSSGLFADELPKVLFFSRIFAELVGRFAPRNKAFILKSPNILVSLAMLKTALCVLFFVYIKAPGRFHRDLISLAFIVTLWLLGGYINTTANIMAPSLVQPCVVGRASAMLALIFQVSHFAGLIVAVVLALALFGMPMRE